MPTDFDRAVAERLRSARKRAGWTQEQLAERIEIDPATMSQYETARLPIPLRVLWRAATTLGVRLPLLVDVDKELPRALEAPPAERRRPRRREESALIEAWAELRPRDRKIVLTLCQTMRKQRS